MRWVLARRHASQIMRSAQHVRAASAMQILNIMQCTNLGGMEQASLLTMRALASRGHRCRVLSLNPVGKLGAALEREGIGVNGMEYRGRGGWRSYPEIRRRVTRESTDRILMTGHSLGAMLALDPKGRERRVLTMHFHHGGVMSETLWRMIYRVALKRFHAVTFMTDFIREEAETIFPPLRQIAHTIPYPFIVPELPSPLTRTAARAALDLPADAKIIGNAGWLIPRKRFDVFLRVAQAIVREHPDTLFVIAGDGPERERLENLSRDLGIADHVRWVGWQSDMRQFYLALDVLLFNSDWDALGRTPLEALALGVPFVASIEHGGLREIIDSDRYGYVRSAHDIDELTSLTSRLLTDREKAEGIARAGRDRLADVGSLEKHGERMSDLLRLG